MVSFIKINEVEFLLANICPLGMFAAEPIDSYSHAVNSDLLVKDQDVTRSTVQKAVVVLASKPVFGPIR